MPIAADSTIEFWGTEDQVSVVSPGPAAVNAGAFSVQGDVVEWVNDDDSPWAYFRFKATAAGLSGAPTAGEVINLYARVMTGVSPELTPTPDANYRATYLGSFVLDAADADQDHIIGPIRLPNYATSQAYEFYVENAMATINIGANGWDLWVKPSTFGPHA